MSRSALPCLVAKSPKSKLDSRVWAKSVSIAAVQARLRGRGVGAVGAEERTVVVVVGSKGLARLKGGGGMLGGALRLGAVVGWGVGGAGGGWLWLCGC